LELELDDLGERIWPGFMANDDIESWGALFSHFAEYQFAFVNESDQVVAGGHTVPFNWSGVVEDLPETIEGVMQNALANRPDSGQSGAQLTSELNYLCAIAALVDESARGQGISRSVLSEMRELARRNDLLGVVVPVRPNFKARHPEISIEDYADWRREDGQLYDPWLRTHERLGAERLGFVPRSFSVIATVEDWRRWTGIAFDHTGAYSVPGALVPVEINLEDNTGSYVEPNVWYLHRV
jgi:GNAT superfamily N-acetyltransferase